MPSPELTSWFDSSSTPNSQGSASTVRANGYRRPIATPGLAIGLATPGLTLPPTPNPNSLAPVHENGSDPSSTRTSSEEKQTDYFTQPLSSSNAAVTPNPNAANGQAAPALLTPSIPLTPSTSRRSHEQQPALAPPTPSEGETGSPNLEKSGLFGKIRGMKIMPKGLKKSATAATTPLPTTEEAPQEELPPVDEKSDKDLFLHALQQVRATYEKQAADEHFALTTSEGETTLPANTVQTMISPSLVNETPHLKLPPHMVILLQEETRSASGIGMGLKDLWEGTVSSTARDADQLERVAPSWLATLLLRNILPRPEVPKISFMLEPWQGVLPRVCAETNTRLNANRMLRARKIMGYVAERIEPPADPEEPSMRPEEYLELYCNNQVLASCC
jgi:WD repeat-containing protein 48